MRRTALFDPTGAYRYRLTRRWQTGGARAAFVLLNPSTADAQRDDPTIRRCMGFARRWGYSAMTVVNIFALRATYPSDLFSAPAPIGPANDRHLREVCRAASMVVLGWGSHGAKLGRDRDVLQRLAGIDLWCLGTTASGQPRHPLYLSRDTEPVRFRV